MKSRSYILCQNNSESMFLGLNKVPLSCPLIAMIEH